jgi:hypothetical protein
MFALAPPVLKRPRDLDPEAELENWVPVFGAGSGAGVVEPGVVPAACGVPKRVRGPEVLVDGLGGDATLGLLPGVAAPPPLPRAELGMWRAFRVEGGGGMYRPPVLGAASAEVQPPVIAATAGVSGLLFGKRPLGRGFGKRALAPASGPGAEEAATLLRIGDVGVATVAAAAAAASAADHSGSDGDGDGEGREGEEAPPRRRRARVQSPCEAERPSPPRAASPVAVVDVTVGAVGSAGSAVAPASPGTAAVGGAASEAQASPSAAPASPLSRATAENGMLKRALLVQAQRNRTLGEQVVVRGVGWRGVARVVGAGCGACWPEFPVGP